MDLEERKKRTETFAGAREVRRIPVSGLELREVDGSLRFSGCASATNRTYRVGWFDETIRSGAFAKTLSERPDTQLLIGHEGLPLARTLSGTLRLSEDQRGLMVDADLDPNDPDVQRLAPKVARGDLTEMSFAFRVPKGRDSWNDDYDAREISEVDIHRGDVSVVAYGANPYTSFSLRDAINGGWKPEADDELAAYFRSLKPMAKPETLTRAEHDAAVEIAVKAALEAYAADEAAAWVALADEVAAAERAADEARQPDLDYAKAFALASSLRAKGRK